MAKSLQPWSALLALLAVGLLYQETSADRIVCTYPKGSPLSDAECAILKRKSSSRCYLDAYDSKWRACRFLCNRQLTKSQSGKKCFDYCNAGMPADSLVVDYFTVPHIEKYCEIVKPTIPPPETATPYSTSSISNQTNSGQDALVSTTMGILLSVIDDNNKNIIIGVSVPAGCALAVAVAVVAWKCCAKKNQTNSPTGSQNGEYRGASYHAAPSTSTASRPVSLSVAATTDHDEAVRDDLSPSAQSATVFIV